MLTGTRLSGLLSAHAKWVLQVSLPPPLYSLHGRWGPPCVHHVCTGVDISKSALVPVYGRVSAATLQCTTLVVPTRYVCVGCCVCLIGGRRMAVDNASARTLETSHSGGLKQSTIDLAHGSTA